MTDNDRKLIRALKAIGDEFDDSPGDVLFQAADRIAELSEELAKTRAELATARDEIEYAMSRRTK